MNGKTNMRSIENAMTALMLFYLCRSGGLKRSEEPGVNHAGARYTISRSDANVLEIPIRFPEPALPEGLDNANG